MGKQLKEFIAGSAGFELPRDPSDVGMGYLRMSDICKFIFDPPLINVNLGSKIFELDMDLECFDLYLI